MGYAWPGNVRELRNAADRFVLGLPLLPGAVGVPQAEGRSLDEQMAVFERHLIQQALTENGGRAATASEAPGLPKKTFYEKLKRHGMSVDDFKSA